MNENYILTPCENCILRSEKELESFEADSLKPWLLLTSYLRRFPWDQEIARFELNVSLGLEKFEGFSECGCERSKVQLNYVSNSLLIDVGHTFFSGANTGIQNFVNGLATEVLRQKEETILFTHSEYGFVQLPFKPNNVKIKFNLMTRIVNNRKLIRRIKEVLPRFLFLKAKNLFIHLKQNAPLLIPVNSTILLPESILDDSTVMRLLALKKSDNFTVTFIHDLFPLSNPQLVSEYSKSHASAISNIARASDLISCQTEAVASAVKFFWKSIQGLEAKSESLPIKVHRRPILITPEIFKPMAIHKDKFLEKLELDLKNTPLVLSVGTIEPRKNYESLLAAAELLWSQNQNFKLIIVGKLGWKTDNFDYIRRIIQSNKRDFQLLQNVDDFTLKFLYSKAKVFVFPSLAEGVGLPPGEALSYGLKPVCRPLPSMLETFSEKDLNLFDGSVGGLAQKIQAEISSIHESSPDRIEVNQNSWEQLVSDLLDDIRGLRER
jgi:glycosyltransferase involved in cell wall biosynthesis